jgi:hypothetical protein
MSKVLSRCSSLFMSSAVVLALLAVLAIPPARADEPDPPGDPVPVPDTCPMYNQGNGDPVGCLAYGSCDTGSCALAGRTCYCPPAPPPGP